MKMLFLELKTQILPFLCAVLLLSSCKKNETATSAPQQDRLRFKNVQELFQTLDQVEKLNEGQIRQWEKDHQHSSFRQYVTTWSEDHIVSKEEESLLALPTSYQILLNKDGEIQVGDTVVWYNQGAKYYVAASDPGLLQKIKKNTSLAVSKGMYSLKTIVKPGTPQTELTNLGLTGLDARWQYPFTQQSSTQGTGCRKWVHEIVGVVDVWANFNDPACGSISSFYVRLLLRIKMEWRNCSRSNYQPAGEQRYVSYNLTKNIRLRGVIAPCTAFEANIPFTGSQSSPQFVTSSNVDVVLAGYAGNTRPSNVYWEVNLDGNIRQQVVGDLGYWDHYGPFF